MAAEFEQVYGWQVTGEDGTWHRLGDAVRAGDVLLYRVKPDQAFAFTVGPAPGQTRYRWSRAV